jgi:hypothetical protein
VAYDTAGSNSTSSSRSVRHWVLGPLVAIVLVVYAGSGLQPAISVALGHGTHGWFIAEQFTESRNGPGSHHGSGTWTGTFRPANNGRVIKDVSYDDSLPGAVPGTEVPALYVGGDAYAAHGSKQWLYDLLFLVLGVSILVGWCWQVPLKYRRRRGSVPPPPWARTA